MSTLRLQPVHTRRVLRCAAALVLCLYVGYHYAGSNPPPQRPNSRQAVASAASFEPSPSLLRRGNTGRREVALTIDDGPHEQWTPQMLKVLRNDHVHATFFVVGRKVRAHPDLAREILAGGNELGNHSMTHRRFDTLTVKEVRKELQLCARAVFDATGATMRLMRPPGLRYTEGILRVARSMHYITVEENIAVGDYIVPGDRSWYRGSRLYARHVAAVKHNVFKQLSSGAIIVIHDMPVTADALDSILKGIAKRGYKVVTVSEMLTHLKPST
ncbi:MAG: polysaccharide deacetylase family protein [Fimbriimonas sp.]|nr:polysaccharide deacetylase family protein [Fimbriimonas sp.]